MFLQRTSRANFYAAEIFGVSPRNILREDNNVFPDCGGGRDSSGDNNSISMLCVLTPGVSQRRSRISRSDAE